MDLKHHKNVECVWGNVEEWGAQCVEAQATITTTVAAVSYSEDISLVLSLQPSTSGLRLMGGARDTHRIVHLLFNSNKACGDIGNKPARMILWSCARAQTQRLAQDGLAFDITIAIYAHELHAQTHAFQITRQQNNHTCVRTRAHTYICYMLACIHACTHASRDKRT